MNSTIGGNVNDHRYVGTMDKRGRIVLRKEMREQMGLTNGGPVKLYVDDSGVLVIAPVKDTQ